MTDKPTITRADREAAWFIRPDGFSKEEYANWRLGVYDGSRSIQTLAKHRESSVAELKAEVERLTGVNRILSESHTWMYTEMKRLENALKDISSRARSALAQEEPVE